MTATLPKNETSNAARIVGSVLLGLASLVTFALGAFYFTVLYVMQDANEWMFSDIDLSYSWTLGDTLLVVAWLAFTVLFALGARAVWVRRATPHS